MVYSAEQLIGIEECCTAVVNCTTSLVETQTFHPLVHYRSDPGCLTFYALKYYIMAGRIAYGFTSLLPPTHVSDWISCGLYLPRIPMVSFPRNLWPHISKKPLAKRLNSSSPSSPSPSYCHVNLFNELLIRLHSPLVAFSLQPCSASSCSDR